MGRRDLTEQRTNEILDACERCVARFGLEGSSLDRVADEAGVKRQMIRHYIGNRQDLIHAFAERLMNRYDRDLEWMMTSLPQDGRVDAILELLFPKQASYSAESTLALEALITASSDYPMFRDRLSSYIESLTAHLSRELRAVFPQSTRAQTWAVSYGIVGLCFNQESLAPLGLPPRYLRASRDCARRLVDSLA